MSVVRWLGPQVPSGALAEVTLPTGFRLAHDEEGRPVVLFGEQWAYEMFVKRYPEIPLSDRPAVPPSDPRGERARAAS